MPSSIRVVSTSCPLSLSCRFSSWEEIATGAASSSRVTSNVITARCRWENDTIRVLTTCTRLPLGVRQMISRVSTPVRKSSSRR